MKSLCDSLWCKKRGLLNLIASLICSLNAKYACTIHGIKSKTNIYEHADIIIGVSDKTIEAIAMLRAAEYAAAFDTDSWIYWEQVILEIQKLNQNPSLDG